MRKFVKRERGITLIELLLALSLGMMISVLIYGVFLSGIKLYNKIAIEATVRDEGDIMLAQIMNEFYRSAPDDVRACPASTNCLVLTTSSTYVIKERTNSFISVDKSAITSKKRTIRFNNQHQLLFGELNEANQITNETVVNSNDMELLTSSITQKCTRFTNKVIDADYNVEKRCISGIVSVDFQMMNRNYKDPNSPLYVKPLQLNSTFGY